MKALLFLVAVASALAQTPNRFLPGVKGFLAVDAPVIALTHVRVIDGTGAAPREDQTIVIDHGKIVSVHGPAPAGAQVLELSGHTVIPGLVGMHEHLYYPIGGGARCIRKWRTASRGSIWRAGSRRRARRGAWSPSRTSMSSR